MNVISSNELEAWLDKIAANFNLIAPHVESGTLLYRRVRSRQEIASTYFKPVLSTKEYFFPQTERLMTIDLGKKGVNLVETFFDQEQVIWGVRSCDARGIKLLDALFLEDDPRDPYYSNRRENTIIIGLACDEMGPSCFCDQVGGGPEDTTGMDIQLKKTSSGFLMHVITDKGKNFLAKSGLLIEDLELTENHQTKGHGNETYGWSTRMQDRFWNEYSQRCLSCRLCAYVCPTCRCFDVRDEVVRGEQKFERIRCWDSCAGENYRRIGGGHQPRADKEERLRNRLLCKFLYYPEQYHLEEQIACTGCGRCIDVCPVGIDITEAINYFTE